MICQNPEYRAEMSESAKFCSECDRQSAYDAKNSLTVEVDTHGGIYQAGRDLIFNSVEPVQSPARYEGVPKWRSPFTLAVLTWIGAVLAVLACFPLWGIVKGVCELFVVRDFTEVKYFILWNFLFLVILIIFGSLIVRLWRMAETETRRPLMFGWSVSGKGRRITFEKFNAGRCPVCYGKLKYCMIGTGWIDYVSNDGQRKRKVMERTSILKCRRNPKHWYEVDPAEDLPISEAAERL